MKASTLNESVDRMIPELLHRLKHPLPRADLPAGEIRIDVSESDEAYEVQAEVPGARKEDIRLHVDGNFVSITAELRKGLGEKAGEHAVLRETCHGRVSRGFSLAHEIDARHVVARLRDGVLSLSLPKRAGSTSGTIEIQ